MFVVLLASVATSLLLAQHAGTMVSIWTANGIATGVLLSTPRRYWPTLITVTLAALVAGLAIAFGTLFTISLLMVPVELTEIVIVTAIIHHYFPVITGQQSGYLRFGRVTICAALAGCSVATLLASFVQRLPTGGASLGTPSDWFRAHLLGMVITGMLTLVAFRERGRMLGERGQRWRMLRDVLLLVAITIAVFAWTRYPLLFVIFAPLLYLIFQYRLPGLVLGVAIVALVTNVCTTINLGPFTLIPTSNPAERAMIAQAFLGVVCLVAVPVALALADRQRLGRRVAESENLYRLLAEYASDIIVRMGSDGTRRYVSPSVREMLGWSPEEFAAQGSELIHPDDREYVSAIVTRLRETGQPAVTRYRLRHRTGNYLWIESLGRLAPSPDHPGETEIIYSGRDVTERVLAEEALADSEKRLRTIADNVPAVIAHVDTEQRYTFINAFASQVMDAEAESSIGRTVEEARGPTVYALLKPHIAQALNGTPSTFEYEVHAGDRSRYFQAAYVPATAADGTLTGFYTLITDITAIKLAEQQLDFLAHHDALTGIANRLSFRESAGVAVQHAGVTQEPLLLMMIDVDYFKHINDTYGHAAGDLALSEVAVRLKASIRKTDLLARLGGDEFVILCRDIEDTATAHQLAQKITDAMRPPVSIGTTEIQVSLSIGVALCRNAASSDALLQCADEALYQAKEAGRACYRLTTDGI